MSFLASPILRLSAFLSLASLVLAQAPATPPAGSAFTFLDWRLIGSYGYANPLPFFGETAAVSFSTCLSYCQTAPGVQTVAWSSYLETPDNCYCGQTLPPAATQNTQSDYSDVDGFQVHTVGSTFSFVQCGNKQDAVVVEQGGGIGVDLKSCFISCRTFTFTAFNWDDQVCACASTASTGPATCSDYGSDYQYFSHSADATASGLARRKRNLTFGKTNQDPNLKFCPAGMSACLVEGGKEGYECLSVDSELESCGGCLSGRSATQAGNATVGRDCSLIPGVSLGGVTCKKGTCDVSSCRKGWGLRDGVCVAVKRR